MCKSTVASATENTCGQSRLVAGIYNVISSYFEKVILTSGEHFKKLCRSLESLLRVENLLAEEFIICFIVKKLQ